uniref:Uncharacterized protein n=1 Tax=Lactuca sativa TaxID=4236 RepID=A0A9R1VQM1_LACSA|nr:hypothetical protein LSAT_V11C400185070 [Lactuca sativa]
MNVPMGYIDMGFHLQTTAYWFDKIEDHLSPNALRIGNRHKYTMHGFVYAFKIWIFETFSNSSVAGSPVPSDIPQAVAFPRTRRSHAPDCERILDVNNLCSLVHRIIYKLICHK